MTTRRSISTLLVFAHLGLLLPATGWTQPGGRGAKAQSAAAKFIAPVDGVNVKVGAQLEIVLHVARQDQVSSVVVLDSDGQAIGVTNQAPFRLLWNTQNAPAGLHTLKGVAYYKDGSSANALPIRVMLTAAAAQPAASATSLKESTPILLTLEEKLVSGDTPQGSTIRFRVDRDVYGAEGIILVAAGTPAVGTVTKSSGSGMFGRAGELNFTLDSTTAVDGTPVSLRAVRNAEADDNVGGVIVGALLLSVFFVFMSGDDVEFEPGTQFTAFVKSDVAVAKPKKATGTAYNGPRSAALLSPRNGEVIRRGSKLTMGCVCTPADDAAFVRIYLNNTQIVAAQKGNLSKIEWDTNRHEKLLKAGEHQLTAEITFASGHIVSAPAVKVVVEE